MKISDKAVEAAARAVLRGINAGHHAYKIAYAALEAAAPHMLAGAWEAAYRQGVEDERTSEYSGTDYGPNRNNPYGSNA